MPRGGHSCPLPRLIPSFFLNCGFSRLGVQPLGEAWGAAKVLEIFQGLAAPGNYLLGSTMPMGGEGALEGKRVFTSKKKKFPSGLGQMDIPEVCISERVRWECYMETFRAKQGLGPYISESEVEYLSRFPS